MPEISTSKFLCYQPTSFFCIHYTTCLSYNTKYQKFLYSLVKINESLCLRQNNNGIKSCAGHKLSHSKCWWNLFSKKFIFLSRINMKNYSFSRHTHLTRTKKNIKYRDYQHQNWTRYTEHQFDIKLTSIVPSIWYQLGQFDHQFDNQFDHQFKSIYIELISIWWKFPINFHPLEIYINLTINIDWMIF